MNNGDYIAIYAAVVATGVAVWDVYKWWRSDRVRLFGRVSSGLIILDNAPAANTRDKKYVSLTVDNRGRLPTLVDSFQILIYDSWWDAWRGNLHKGAVVLNPLHVLKKCDLPYTLEPGASYGGLCEQTEELEEWTRKKRTYLGIHHSMSNRPYKVRLKPIVKSK
jgi:hypothetical protein